MEKTFEERKEELEQQIVSHIVDGEFSFENKSCYERYEYAYRAMELARDYCCLLGNIDPATVRIGFLKIPDKYSAWCHKEVLNGELRFNVAMASRGPLMGNPYSIFQTSFHEMRHVMQIYERREKLLEEDRTLQGRVLAEREQQPSTFDVPQPIVPDQGVPDVQFVATHQPTNEQQGEEPQLEAKQFPQPGTIVEGEDSSLMMYNSNGDLILLEPMAVDDTLVPNSPKRKSVLENVVKAIKGLSTTEGVEKIIKTFDEASKVGYGIPVVGWAGQDDELDAELFSNRQMKHFLRQAIIKEPERRVSFAHRIRQTDGATFSTGVNYFCAKPFLGAFVAGTTLGMIASGYIDQESSAIDEMRSLVEHNADNASIITIDQIKAIADENPELFHTKDYAKWPATRDKKVLRPFIEELKAKSSECADLVETARVQNYEREYRIRAIASGIMLPEAVTEQTEPEIEVEECNSLNEKTETNISTEELPLEPDSDTMVDNITAVTFVDPTVFEVYAKRVEALNKTKTSGDYTENVNIDEVPIPEEYSKQISNKEFANVNVTSFDSPTPEE